MARLFKWITGGVGWLLGGPIGALIGLAAGAFIEKLGKDAEGNVNEAKRSYLVSLMVLVAAMMKADGKVLRSELNFVKTFLRTNFNEDDAKNMLGILKDLLQKDIDVVEVCHQISSNVRFEGRLQLGELLWGVAISDGNVCDKELQMLEKIYHCLGLSVQDFKAAKARYIPDTNWAYDIIGVSSNSTDDEIKKAYRKIAMINHPDKVEHLGEEIKEAAKKKFQKITEAYNVIKKERNIH